MMPHRRRGTILIIAMVVLFALAALVLTLGRSARSEALTAANAKAAAEADAIERGAEQYALSILANNADTLNDLTENDFANVAVGGGAFWITRPTYNDAAVSQYGLLDESSKLNLNTATAAQLPLLKGMTDDLADEIIAWRGGNATGDAGASAIGGGSVKNAPFETVDEMLLLTDMTRDLLYGTKSSSDAPNVNTDWYQQHGLADFFTVWSTQPSAGPDGNPRINITDRANFGAFIRILNSVLPGKGYITAPRSFIDVFDVANTFQLSADDISKIADYVTTSLPDQPLNLVNINTAPREVLIALERPEADIDALIAARPNAIASAPNSIGWVYDTLKERSIGLGRLITGRGRQYSADIVAASGNGRAFRHVRIVIDTSASPAKIVYRRDITDRGWPLDASILSNLRSGQGGASSVLANKGTP